jgi:hypothetical protein
MTAKAKLQYVTRRLAGGQLKGKVTSSTPTPEQLKQRETERLEQERRNAEDKRRREQQPNPNLTLPAQKGNPAAQDYIPPK